MVGSYKSDEIEIEPEGPDRFLQILEDEHQFVEKGLLFEVRLLDVLGGIVGDDFEVVGEDDPEEGSEEIEDLLKEPDVCLFRRDAREIAHRVESPASDDLFLRRYLGKVIIKSCQHMSPFDRSTSSRLRVSGH